MNRDRARGSWKQLKGWVRQRWARLTDNPANEVLGELEVRIGKLQKAYGLGKEAADKRLEAWRAVSNDAANDHELAPRHLDARL